MLLGKNWLDMGIVHLDFLQLTCIVGREAATVGMPCYVCNPCYMCRRCSLCLNSNKGTTLSQHQLILADVFNISRCPVALFSDHWSLSYLMQRTALSRWTGCAMR